MTTSWTKQSMAMAAIMYLMTESDDYLTTESADYLILNQSNTYTKQSKNLSTYTKQSKN
jgi:hypothetical protein